MESGKREREVSHTQTIGWRKPNTDLHQDAMIETVAVVDEEAVHRSFGG
jgi:hypothetical protein